MVRRPHGHSHRDLIDVQRLDARRERVSKWVKASTVRQVSNRPGFPVSHVRFSNVFHCPGDHRELVVVEVTYPPGGIAPLHRHPVGGVVFIIEGVAESAYGSDDPRQYRAGETLQDRADIPHTLFRNCDPEGPLRFLTIYVLEPGRSYTMEP
nr:MULTISPECIES: cupin domain-containing protein [unclassified Bradyrhizobium]